MHEFRKISCDILFPLNDKCPGHEHTLPVFLLRAVNGAPSPETPQGRRRRSIVSKGQIVLSLRLWGFLFLVMAFLHRIGGGGSSTKPLMTAKLLGNRRNYAGSYPDGDTGLRGVQVDVEIERKGRMGCEKHGWLSTRVLGCRGRGTCNKSKI